MAAAIMTVIRITNSVRMLGRSRSFFAGLSVMVLLIIHYSSRRASFTPNCLSLR